MAATDTREITIRRRDDWHVHVRDGAMLAMAAPHTQAQFARAIIMPNLVPPVTTTAEARAYRERIRAALPAKSRFEPLMTCYLTDETDADDLARGRDEGVFTAPAAFQLYAQVFDEEGALDRFEAFASENGPAFYGLPRNEERTTLVRDRHAVPANCTTKEGDSVIPFLAGDGVGWRLVGG